MPRKTYGAEAYGKTVWSWRPWLASSCRWRMVSYRRRSAVKPAAMEARGIRLQGEPGISRKTTAQGMPECSDCTCMLVCATLRTYCTRDRGCSKHPAFPAPSLRGAKNSNNSGETCRENADAHSLVVPREGGGPSIPEATVIETGERSVLDTRRSLSSGSPKARPGGGYDNPSIWRNGASFATTVLLCEAVWPFRIVTVRNSTPASELR